MSIYILFIQPFTKESNLKCAAAKTKLQKKNKLVYRIFCKMTNKKKENWKGPL